MSSLVDSFSYRSESNARGDLSKRNFEEGAKSSTYLCANLHIGSFSILKYPDKINKV